MAKWITIQTTTTSVSSAWSPPAEATIRLVARVPLVHEDSTRTKWATSRANTNCNNRRAMSSFRAWRRCQTCTDSIIWWRFSRSTHRRHQRPRIHSTPNLTLEHSRIRIILRREIFRTAVASISDKATKWRIAKTSRSSNRCWAVRAAATWWPHRKIWCNSNSSNNTWIWRARDSRTSTIGSRNQTVSKLFPFGQIWAYIRRTTVL